MEQERAKILPFTEAPYNLKLGILLSARYAVNRRWLTGLPEDVLPEKIQYLVTDRKRECSLVVMNGIVSEREDVGTGRRDSTIKLTVPLTTGHSDFSLLFEAGLTPRRAARWEDHATGVEVERANFQFVFENGVGLFVIFSSGSAMVLVTRGEVTSVIYDGKSWESPKARAGFGQFFNPILVEMPMAAWIAAVDQAVAGEFTARNGKSARRKMEQAIVARGELMAGIFGGTSK